MTIREAMLTLNGELDMSGNPTDHGKKLRMERMLARLAKLQQEKQDAESLGFGDAILGEINADIRCQERCIALAS